MKSSQVGKNILVSIENITPLGIWLYIGGKEYFMSYNQYPYFREQKLSSIFNVRLIHENHLYWPDLDVDLEIDNLEHPEKYQLKAKILVPQIGEKSAPKYNPSKKD
jgi:hypothetical protein